MEPRTAPSSQQELQHPASEVITQVSSLLSEHGYPLSHHYRQANRINLQHFLRREHLQYTIHPTILEHFRSQSGYSDTDVAAAPLKIADIACGTASWLIDAARELPNSSLEGLDISLELVPHHKWLEDFNNATFTFYEWDFLHDPVPIELVGRYDLVHVNWALLRLVGKDTKAIVSRLYELLKPGGYIQLDEWDYERTSVGVEEVEPALETPTLNELTTLWRLDERTSDFPRRLLEDEGGFHVLVVERAEDKRELRRAVQELHMLRVEEAAVEAITLSSPQAVTPLFLVIDEARKEIAQGAWLDIPFMVVVAVRPE
ncbi:S-adenosyl-L-methionine-dependent methyltransferase [Aspergillus karnatakaensis]|uniref:S-adenosyl-L-methionine-dependent methyltransferase n=1 Tax=Aspergillus karnatakaensis TaxID=1810916 RepID=UPI003CCCA838